MASCETLENQDPSAPPPPSQQHPHHSKKTPIQEKEKEKEKEGAEAHNNPPIETTPAPTVTLIDAVEEQNPTNPNSIQPSDDEEDEEEYDDDNNDDNSLEILEQKRPPMTSPTNTRSSYNNQKKGSKKKGNKMKNKNKIKNLTHNLKPIPFVNKSLELVKYEGVLKKLGLYDFTQIHFDSNIETHLISQLIVNYDPKKRASVVNGYRINVNRPALARALKLPLAKQQQDNKPPQVDLDSEVFSEDDIGFLENFVMNWILLGEQAWDFHNEIANWTRCIRDNHPERLDSATLIWYMVEKELSQGDKLVHCYYVSHLQYLIKSQRANLFNHLTLGKEDVEDIAQEDAQAFKVVVEQEVVNENDRDVPQDSKVVEEITTDVVKEIDREMMDAQQDFKVLDAEENVVKENDREMVDAQQDFLPDVEERGNWEFSGNNILLQRCQNNNFEETKVEDEQIDPVDEEDDEDVDEGFDMEEANDESLEDRDGLTGNYLQGVETSQAPFGISSMDLFGSRDASFMSHDAGPSFVNKRAMDHEEDISHLDGNNKRLKMDTMLWDQKPNDFGFCIDQMQQLMERAKMIYESKEQSYANSQYDQQVTLNEMQKRHNFFEMVIKSKDEELQRKNDEVFRLERELYLMGDLVQGYRKALNDTRLKFSDYRKRYALKEEPLYKDAGPGGLVFSTRELEQIRIKQEEDRVKFIALAKTLEDEFLNVFEKLHADVLMMVDKLVSVENEWKSIKELFTLRKETQKGRYEQELFAKPEDNPKSTDRYELEENQKSVDDHVTTPEPEENQKSVDETAGLEGNQKSLGEILDNDVTVESVSPDAA